jgi:hypothetical protein
MFFMAAKQIGITQYRSAKFGGRFMQAACRDGQVSMGRKFRGS